MQSHRSLFQPNPTICWTEWEEDVDLICIKASVSQLLNGKQLPQLFSPFSLR